MCVHPANAHVLLSLALSLRKVFSQRYSTLILQSQTYVRVRLCLRPSVRRDARYPNYAAAAEHYLCTLNSPTRFPRAEIYRMLAEQKRVLTVRAPTDLRDFALEEII